LVNPKYSKSNSFRSLAYLKYILPSLKSIFSLYSHALKHSRHVLFSQTIVLKIDVKNFLLKNRQEHDETPKEFMSMRNYTVRSRHDTL